MPEADKFTALGAGNGFPECLRRVDVSTYDHWMTLGGNRDGAPFDKSKTGLTECMNFYWNIHAMLCDSFEQFTSDETGVIRTDFSKTTDNPDYPEPKNRVCGQEVTNLAMYGDLMDFSRLDQLSDWVMVMYDGDTKDKDNFVGYGINEEALMSHSLLNFSSVALTSGIPGWVIGYSNFGGIQLLTTIVVDEDVDTDETKIIMSADPENGQYSYLEEHFINDEDPGDPPIWVLEWTYIFEAQFIGFEFYTYPS